MRATKLSQSIWRAHHAHAGVMSRQDYSAVCEASISLTEAQCPFPVAKAYDHMSGDISDRVVTSRRNLILLCWRTLPQLSGSRTCSISNSPSRTRS